MGCNGLQVSARGCCPEAAWQQARLATVVRIHSVSAGSMHYIDAGMYPAVTPFHSGSVMTPKLSSMTGCIVNYAVSLG